MAANAEIQQAGHEFYNQLKVGVEGVDFRGLPVTFVLKATDGYLDVIRDKGRNTIYPLWHFVTAVALTTDRELNQAPAVVNEIKQRIAQEENQ